MNRLALRRAQIAALFLAGTALSACGEGGQGAAPTMANDDPLMRSALADQIMIDPDMVNRNGANRVAQLSAVDGIIPLPDNGHIAIDAARAEALDLIGGSAAMVEAPEPRMVGGELPQGAALSLALRASGVGEAIAACVPDLQFSFAWAAQMAADVPIYPRAAVHQAAGTDAGGCAIRALNFSTPVSADDVLDFYYTQTSNAGFDVQLTEQGGYRIMTGTRGEGEQFALYLQGLPNGRTDIDLVISGM